MSSPASRSSPTPSSTAPTSSARSSCAPPSPPSRSRAHPTTGPHPPHRRPSLFGAWRAGLIAAIATVALAGASGHWVSAAAAALATLALIIFFLAIYNRVSKPVNTALTAAALAERAPGDARQLQARSDSVINARVALQTLALAALCVALAAPASRRLSGWEPAALITTRNRPICQPEGTNEQPGS